MGFIAHFGCKDTLAARRCQPWRWNTLRGQALQSSISGLFFGLDHRFGQHSLLHRYQPWQVGFPVDCYGPNDDHGRRNLDCAPQAPLHPGYADDMAAAFGQFRIEPGWTITTTETTFSSAKLIDSHSLLFRPLPAWAECEG